MNKFEIALLLLTSVLTSAAGSYQEKTGTSSEPVLMDVEIEEHWLDYLTVPYLYQKQHNEIPDSYLVQQAATIDTQHGMECSACSCAYLLRFYGYEADYLTIYDEITLKMENGTVYPKALDIVFDGYEDLDAVFYNGTIDDLKDALCTGIPQIVLVRIAPTNNTLHYVTVVGYDEDKVYMQDSYSSYRNENSPLYNRSVSYKEFEAMWSNAVPCMDHSFITVIKCS